ncbi:MAG: DUF4394 domain-containing protein [Alsobacter sp.]
MKAVTVKVLATAVLFQAATLAAAQAQVAVALVGDDTLATVDVQSRKVTGTAKIAGAKLVGLDVRPADGMLYALSADGQIWTVDPGTGKPTPKSKLDVSLPAGVAMTVDFNPVADRLRVIGSDGTNLRINVEDGKTTKDGTLKFAEGDMHKGETPKIVAGAYTNSMKGAKETTLFDIDGTIGALIKQAPPNDGILNAVGKLGIKADAAAFDIITKPSGQSEGVLMAGDTLYMVDLASGKATVHGKIQGVGASGVRDIAVLPAM